MAILEIQNKNSEGLPLKIFLASPSDLRVVRKTVKRIFTEKHDMTYKDVGYPLYWLYMWEHNKTAGDDNDDESTYQNEIFEEFGDWCDIFIILCGKKYGKGTIIEYNHYKNVFKKVNSDCKLLPFVIPDLSSEKDKYMDADWLKWVNDNISADAIGGKERNALRTPKAFERELKEQENKYSRKMIRQLQNSPSSNLSKSELVAMIDERTAGSAGGVALGYVGND